MPTTTLPYGGTPGMTYAQEKAAGIVHDSSPKSYSGSETTQQGVGGYVPGKGFVTSTGQVFQTNNPNFVPQGFISNTPTGVTYVQGSKVITPEGTSYIGKAVIPGLNQSANELVGNIREQARLAGYGNINAIGIPIAIQKVINPQVNQTNISPTYVNTESLKQSIHQEAEITNPNIYEGFLNGIGFRQFQKNLPFIEKDLGFDKVKQNLPLIAKDLGITTIINSPLIKKIESLGQKANDYIKKVEEQVVKIVDPTYYQLKQNEIRATERYNTNIETLKKQADSIKNIKDVDEYNKQATRINNTADYLTRNYNNEIKGLQMKTKEYENSGIGPVAGLVTGLAESPFQVAEFGVGILTNPVQTIKDTYEGIINLPSQFVSSGRSAGEVVGSIAGQILLTRGVEGMLKAGELDFSSPEKVSLLKKEISPTAELRDYGLLGKEGQPLFPKITEIIKETKDTIIKDYFNGFNKIKVGFGNDITTLKDYVSKDIDNSLRLINDRKNVLQSNILPVKEIPYYNQQYGLIGESKPLNIKQYFDNVNANIVGGLNNLKSNILPVKEIPYYNEAYGLIGEPKPLFPKVNEFLTETKNSMDRDYAKYFNKIMNGFNQDLTYLKSIGKIKEITKITETDLAYQNRIESMSNKLFEELVKKQGKQVSSVDEINQNYIKGQLKIRLEQTVPREITFIEKDLGYILPNQIKNFIKETKDTIVKDYSKYSNKITEGFNKDITNLKNFIEKDIDKSIKLIQDRKNVLQSNILPMKELLFYDKDYGLLGKNNALDNFYKGIAKQVRINIGVNKMISSKYGILGNEQGFKELRKGMEDYINKIEFQDYKKNKKLLKLKERIDIESGTKPLKIESRAIDLEKEIKSISSKLAKDMAINQGKTFEYLPEVDKNFMTGQIAAQLRNTKSLREISLENIRKAQKESKLRKLSIESISNDIPIVDIISMEKENANLVKSMQEPVKRIRTAEDIFKQETRTQSKELPSKNGQVLVQEMDIQSEVAKLNTETEKVINGEQKVETVQETRLRSFYLPDTSYTTAVDSFTKLDYRTKQELKTDSQFKQQLKDLQRLGTTSGTRSNQITNLRLNIESQVKQDVRQDIKQRERIIQKEIQEEIEKLKPKELIFQERRYNESSTQKKKSEQGYDVYGKMIKSNSFMKLNENPLKKSRAKDVGAFYVAQTLARSFKISKSSKPAQPDYQFMSIPEGYFIQNERTLREYKIRKRQIIGTPEQYIQKSMFAISSENEKRQIKEFQRQARNILR